MRTLAFLHKTFLENLRDWKILIITLAFAPFFVYLMYAYFGATVPAYSLLVANADVDAYGRPTPASSGLVDAWRAVTHGDGKAALVVTDATDLASATAAIRAREADLVAEIPAGFAGAIAALRGGTSRDPARVRYHADESNLRSSMAMAFADYVAFGHVAKLSGVAVPFEPELERVGAARPLSDFDLYVPALLVLAVIMVLFTAAATLIREVDKRTMTRLVLSRLSTAEMLTAVTVNQVLIGTAALALAFGAAWSVGYRTTGSLAAVLAVGALSTVGVVALSVLTAAFLKSTFELLTVGCFPFFILMFFSESMFPLPRLQVATLAGHAVYANDVLPTTPAVRAFGKILSQGAGLGDVTFELAGMVVLTAAYFALGTWLFRRRHMRA